MPLVYKPGTSPCCWILNLFFPTSRSLPLRLALNHFYSTTYRSVFYLNDVQRWHIQVPRWHLRRPNHYLLDLLHLRCWILLDTTNWLVLYRCLLTHPPYQRKLLPSYYEQWFQKSLGYCVCLRVARHHAHHLPVFRASAPSVCYSLLLRKKRLVLTQRQK